MEINGVVVEARVPGEIDPLEAGVGARRIRLLGIVVANLHTRGTRGEEEFMPEMRLGATTEVLLS